MRLFEPELLAEKVAAVERHLARVEARLPSTPAELQPASDASDAVILHLWQGVQLVIDLALSACVKLDLGTPPTYAGAFEKLGQAGHLEPELTQRLCRAAGFRNLVAHAYEGLDMERLWKAAREGPADLRAFLASMAAR